MDIYTPENIPEMEIEYTIVDPGQPTTFYQPGFKPEIEISNIKVNGDYVSEGLFFLLMEQHEGEWIGDIQESLKSRMVA